MQMSLKKENERTYAVLDAEDVQPENFEINMINCNDIGHVLPIEFRCLNKELLIYYNVDGMNPVSSFFEKTGSNIVLIKNLYRDILEVIDNLKDYLLDPDALIISPDSIFFDEENQNFNFIYFPGCKKDVRHQVKDLAEASMKYINYRDREVVEFSYFLFDLTSKENYKLADISKELEIYDVRNNNPEIFEVQKNWNTEMYETRGHKAADTRPVVREKNMSSFRNELLDEVFAQEEDVYKIDFDLGKKRDVNYNDVYKKLCIGSLVITATFGLILAYGQYKATGHIEYVKPLVFVLAMMAIETFVYLQLCKNDEHLEKTAYVIENKKHRYYLEPLMMEDDTICLSSDVISESPYGSKQIYELFEGAVVGRDVSAGIYIDNKNVSRSHAQFHFENSKLILKDLASTNGTYINDCLISAENPVVVSVGDVITFGNLKYCVKYA